VIFDAKIKKHIIGEEQLIRKIMGIIISKTNGLQKSKSIDIEKKYRSEHKLIIKSLQKRHKTIDND